VNTFILIVVCLVAGFVAGIVLKDKLPSLRITRRR